MRRTVDIGGALLALVLLAPFLLGIGLLIVITDGLPVLFRQTRVGKNGRPFLILKFRTMRSGVPGGSITAAGDSRVTRVGGWLRRLKLDELPQFLNVLRGEMSLIGPRPEVPDYVQYEDPLWQAVLSIRPGITDIASLAFRDEEQLLGPVPDADRYYRAVILPAKLRLNILYLRSRSFMTDLRLLWLTALYSLAPSTFSRNRVLKTLRNRA
jgi:lipopolysaccharide/colanic/teichoic acid biosynthesis glycosyltransferase